MTSIDILKTCHKILTLLIPKLHQLKNRSFKLRSNNRTLCLDVEFGVSILDNNDIYVIRFQFINNQTHQMLELSMYYKEEGYVGHYIISMIQLDFFNWRTIKEYGADEDHRIYLKRDLEKYFEMMIQDFELEKFIFSKYWKNLFDLLKLELI